MQPQGAEGQGAEDRRAVLLSPRLLPSRLPACLQARLQARLPACLQARSIAVGCWPVTCVRGSEGASGNFLAGWQKFALGLIWCWLISGNLGLAVAMHGQQPC